MERLEPRLRLYEGAFNAIRRYIVQKGLRPGDPLPSERQIQVQLGISRAPVREALRVLQSHGLVEARQGKGLFVKEMDLRPVVDAFVSHLDLIEPEAFDHLLELRQLLELGASELAAQRRTPEDLAVLAATLAAMRGRLERAELVLQEDLGFHDALVHAAHNPLLERLYACMTPFLVAVREKVAPTEQALASSLADHTAIYQAVSDGDAGLAARLMQEHMVSVRERLKEGSDD